jgi:hypothetical protein|tara:strand:+ start:866 stop:1075 length:210 start_codon:yes stop_codon:yes gene_type:complete
MQPKVEKNIPLPAINKTNKYGFLSDVKIGDSFIVKSYDTASYRNAMKRYGYKCVTRREGLDTHRMWRTK